MSWHATDDRFPSHSKVYELRQYTCHDSSVALWLLSGAWCSGQVGHNFTGYVPSHMIHMFGITNPAEAAQALVDVGLWESRDGGWWFHDWAHWNGPAAKNNRAKEQTRARTQAWRIRLCTEAGDDLTQHSADCPTTDMDGNPRTCPSRESKETQMHKQGSLPSQPAPPRPGVTSRAVTCSDTAVEGDMALRDVTDHQRDGWTEDIGQFLPQKARLQ